MGVPEVLWHLHLVIGLHDVFSSPLAWTALLLSSVGYWWTACAAALKQNKWAMPGREDGQSPQGPPGWEERASSGLEDLRAQQPQHWEHLRIKVRLPCRP